MNHLIFLMYGFLAVVVTPTAHALVDSEQIRHEVIAHVKEVYASRFSPQSLDNNVEILPSNLDARLNLKPCDSVLEKRITSAAIMAHNITVKVSCTGTNRWTIYVPVTVNIYQEVAVASRNLGRGVQISESDIMMTKTNVAQAGTGYFDNAKALLGMEVKRHLRAGDTITANQLTAPTVIKRGEQVALESNVAGIQVVATAKALSNGQLGAPIRVQNTQSKRIIEAFVTAPGRVSTRPSAP